MMKPTASHRFSIGASNPRRVSGFRRLLLIGALASALVVLLAGCNRPAESDELTPAPGASATVEDAALSSSTEESAEAPADARQLVIWAPPFMSITQDSNADAVLAAAITQFEQDHPNVRVEIQTKEESGTSSAFNYLRSAQKAAPSVLPDIALLSTDELWQAAELGLIPPLERSDLARMGDFYTFARQAVAFEDQILGVPYVADMLHLVYHQGNPETPPRTWEMLFDLKQPYLFPAASPDGYSNDSLLLQYVGAGGELLESGEVSNPAALEAVFEFLMDGRELGVIPPEVDGYARLQTVWEAFLASDNGMADTSVHLILSRQDTPETSDYGVVPTLIGEPTTIARTWAFAILSDDPEQRELALALIQALLEPSVHGSWSQFSARTPTQPAAFDAWSTGNAYYEFLRSELAPVAVAIPNGRRFADFSARLQEAQHKVLSGQSTPADAALDVQVTP